MIQNIKHSSIFHCIKVREKGEPMEFWGLHSSKEAKQIKKKQSFHLEALKAELKKPQV